MEDWNLILTDRVRNTDENTTSEGRAILSEIILVWRRFKKMTDARDSFADVPCVYVQSDNRGVPVRVGETSIGLENRYRGGNGFALDAAMHNSGNLVFVAEVPEGLSEEIEKELIWRERETLLYNNQHKSNPPLSRIRIQHQGEKPEFSAAKPLV